jgi:hypothetical protein
LNQLKLKTHHHVLYLFLILVFSLPRTIQGIKIVVLAVMVLFFLFQLKIKKDFSNRILLYSLFFLIPLFTAGIYGNNAAYVFDGIKIYFLFPLLILLILQIFDKDELIEIIYNSSWIAIILIAINGVLSLLYGFGMISFNINTVFYSDEEEVGVYEGFIHLINSSLSYLIFIVPICFMNLNKLKFNKLSFYFFIFLFIFSLISGRRILVLPFILLLLYHFRRFYKYLIFITLITYFVLDTTKFENFDPSAVIDRFQDAISSSGDSEVREEQVYYFEKHIYQKPIFGHGLGAYMNDYIRSKDFETAYEKSYHYLFFVMGIPFAFFFILYHLYLSYKSLTLTVNDETKKKGILLGIVSLVLATSTNPYWLSSFDYTIPLAILIRLSQDDAKQSFGYISNV